MFINLLVRPKHRRGSILHCLKPREGVARESVFEEEVIVQEQTLVDEKNDR